MVNGVADDTSLDWGFSLIVVLSWSISSEVRKVEPALNAFRVFSGEERRAANRASVSLAASCNSRPDDLLIEFLVLSTTFASKGLAGTDETIVDGWFGMTTPDLGFPRKNESLRTSSLEFSKFCESR